MGRGERRGVWKGKGKGSVVERCSDSTTPFRFGRYPYPVSQLVKFSIALFENRGSIQYCFKENLIIMWRPFNGKIFVMNMGCHMMERQQF